LNEPGCPSIGQISAAKISAAQNEIQALDAVTWLSWHSTVQIYQTLKGLPVRKIGEPGWDMRMDAPLRPLKQAVKVSRHDLWLARRASRETENNRMLICWCCGGLFLQDRVDDMLNGSSAVILMQQVEDLIERGR
jgi:hypothetical protein